MKTILLLLLCAATASAATIAASSASKADVQTAIDAASDGDTVEIPNGSATWATGITTTKQIRIRALNITVTDEGSDTRNVTITHSAGSAALFDIESGSSFHVRISGIKFLRGTGTGTYITMDGTGSKPPLIDDCYFSMPSDFNTLRGVHARTLGGVFWNCMWESLTPGGASGPGSGSGCFYVEPPSGSLPWTSVSTLGTADTGGNKNLYIEDCQFRHIYNQALDAADHARVVVRYSTVLNSQFLTHGSTGLAGARQFEVYNCAFQYRTASFGDTWDDVAMNRYMWFRAGTGVFADCSWENINSGTWGNKTEIHFTVENLHRGDFNGNGESCCDTYPCYHQTGFGHNGSAQVSDPIYIWGVSGFTPVIGYTEGSPDDCGGGPSSSSFVVLNRDYFLGSTAKPGYTKYTYPHPLRSDSVPTSVLRATTVNAENVIKR